MENDEITDCTLFVGDLSRDVSKEDLYNLFEMVGVVHEAVVKCSNVTGQPMGYGFVRMATRDDAEHALQALAGMNLKGRSIRVGRAERNCRLIVKNLDRSVRFEDLLHIFLPYGSLQMYDSGQEVSVNGFCARILHFVRRADAERAKRDLHMQIFHGRPMHVEWYRHTPDDVNESGNSRNEPVVSVHVRFTTVEPEMKVDEHLLYHIFKKYGEVTKISIKALIQDKDTNLSRGYAFVHFPPNLLGCQSALEAASAMDDVMYNGVHFYSKPSQNFHRAHDELLRQDNQQQLQYSQSNTSKQTNYPQTSSTRRYPDQSGPGRVVRPPAPPHLSPPKVKTPHGYFPSAGRAISNTSAYNSDRYYDENMSAYPRIMQYQHAQPEYPPRVPYPYPEYTESDQVARELLWSSPTYGSQYPRPYNYNQEGDALFGTTEIMKPNGPLPRGQASFKVPSQNEFLRSSDSRNQRGYPSMSTEHGYPFTYSQKEMFPQEYYDAYHFESNSIPSRQAPRFHNPIPADSGLNIDASAFHPANTNPGGRMMPNSIDSEKADPYNLANLSRHAPQTIRDNSRGSYVTSETNRPHNIDIHDHTDDIHGPDVVSGLIDPSLSSDTEHQEEIAETNTHEY